MKTASDLKAITTDVLQTRLSVSRERATELLTKTIIPQMENAAHDGHFSTICHIPSEVAIDTIVTTLQDNGYKVSRTGRKLTIGWIS